MTLFWWKILFFHWQVDTSTFSKESLTVWQSNPSLSRVREHPNDLRRLPGLDLEFPNVANVEIFLSISQKKLKIGTSTRRPKDSLGPALARQGTLHNQGSDPKFKAMKFPPSQFEIPEAQQRTCKKTRFTRVFDTFSSDHFTLLFIVYHVIHSREKLNGTNQNN